MAGICGADIVQLRAHRRRQITAWAFVPAILAVNACATSLPDPGQQATTEPAAPSAPSCTMAGSHRILPSVYGSFPLLPLSKRGEEFTPTVALAGTKADATPPTASISLAAEAPDPSPVFFNGVQLGSEATLNGYTIRITSICDKDVLFDLVAQPE